MPKSKNPARKAGAKPMLGHQSRPSRQPAPLLPKQGLAGGYLRQVKPMPLPGKSRGR